MRILSPDVLLLAANMVILVLAGGDGRIFMISVIGAITIRYVLLAGMVFADWRDPAWFAHSRFRHMVKDPSEGGAYEGGGAETPLWGHFVFLAMFGWLPMFGVLYTFDRIPLSEQTAWILAAGIAAELRDVAAGGVIYFRSGAGQCRNASWNFTQVLALVVSLLTVPALIFPALLIAIVIGFFTHWSYEVSGLFSDELGLWVISLWVLGTFHTLLYVDGSRN